MPFDTLLREGTGLAARLARIDCALDQARGSIRFHPARRAVWRWLLMPSAAVVALARLLPVLGDAAERTAGLGEPIPPLDAIAIRLVARAILGDVKAAHTIFHLIEGKPCRRPEIQPSGGLDSMVIEQLVRLLQERAAPPPQRPRFEFAITDAEIDRLLCLLGNGAAKPPPGDSWQGAPVGAPSHDVKRPHQPG